MIPHRIRLRKPWQIHVTENGVLWRRRFGRPTGLQSRDTVWLVIEGVPAASSVRLNDELLGRIVGQPMAGRFDVTGRLRQRNVLALLVQVADRPAQAATSDQPADVFLEIVAGETGPP
jgi:hypothetical protein